MLTARERIYHEHGEITIIFELNYHQPGVEITIKTAKFSHGYCSETVLFRIEIWMLHVSRLDSHLFQQLDEFNGHWFGRYMQICHPAICRL